MDGDSFPEPEATRRMVGYFRDEEIKGVTPAMKVRNPENWVEKVIWTEYIYQIFLRKLFAFLDAQYVMPGPGSLYRTDYLKELGGWDEETLTEDMEIAFRMYGSGALLENSTNAYVDTVSPSSLKGLFRQRIRWYRGYLNNFLRYRRFIFNPRYGNLGFIFMPFNAVWTLLVLFMVGHMVFRMGDTILQSAQMYMMLGYVPLGFSFGLQNLSLFHFFYGVLTGTGIIMLLLSIKTAGEELKLWRRKMNYVLFLWIYATLYAGFWIAAVVEEIRGGRTRW